MTGVGAHESTELSAVEVRARAENLEGVAAAGSEGVVSSQRLAAVPILRPGEVLEMVPGLIVTQHAGDGKANQYFLRGFNLDHGTDFATYVGGVPVNMPSHAHGQGYTDLNFLIPELVDRVSFRKGPYFAEEGDFSSAGAARIDYFRSLDASLAQLTLGRNGYARSLLAGSPELAGGKLLYGLELFHNDGPWEVDEHYRKLNGVLRYSQGSRHNGFSLTGMAYQGQWTSTDQVARRAVDSGLVGRFGTLDPTTGGETHRYSLSGDWAKTTEASTSKANLYVIDYALNLYSAPSGFINGPQGDQHEQADQRTVWGGQGSHSWFLGPEWKDTELLAGVQLRHDRIGKLGLYTTEGRQRTGTVREDRIEETAIAALFEARTQWMTWLRSSFGLRHDRISATATALGGQFNLGNGGDVSAGQTSPKIAITLGPFDLLGKTEFYANWGQGFHSNDVRGATAVSNPQDGSAATAVPLIVKAKGSEIGLRTNPLPGWRSSLALWQMELASELVFIGDEGITEPKGASRRQGVEWSNYITPADGWIVDADLAWSRARFTEANPANGGRYVPNAIPITASLGITADSGGAWFGGLRLRYLGSYALEESGQQKSMAFWMANLKAGYRINPTLQVSLDILNLFDRKANDIEYWGGACTRSEMLGGTCGGGIDGRLLHPLEPRTVRLGLRASF